MCKAEAGAERERENGRERERDTHRQRQTERHTQRQTADFNTIVNQFAAQNRRVMASDGMRGKVKQLCGKECEKTKAVRRHVSVLCCAQRRIQPSAPPLPPPHFHTSVLQHIHTHTYTHTHTHVVCVCVCVCVCVSLSLSLSPQCPPHPHSLTSAVTGSPSSPNSADGSSGSGIDGGFGGSEAIVTENGGKTERNKRKGREKFQVTFCP